MPLNNNNASAGDRIAGKLSVKEGGHGGATAEEGLLNLDGIPRNQIAQPNGPIPLDENENIPLADIESLIQTDITITGPTTVTCGLETRFAITNYDSYFSYSLYVDVGEVSIEGQFVIYKAPVAPGPCGFYIDGRFIELTAVEGAIQRPTITAPAEGYMANTDTFNIEATPFDVTDNTGGYFEVLKSVDWELSKTNDFNVLFRSSYGGINTAWSVTGLDLDQDYFIRVRYHGIERSSEWSMPRMFRATSQPYLTNPTIISPSNGATNQLLTLTITSSAFTPFNYTDTHASTDWQVATDPDFTAIQFQSLLDASNLVSWPVSGLEYGTIYYVRARYHGVLDSSGWSTGSTFTAKADDRVINAPSIASPLNASTGNPLRPVIQSSDFSANFAENHVNTDWQVSTNTSFTNLIINIAADNVNKLSYEFTFDLSYATTYYVRVKHRGNIKVSEWSNYSQFTVKADDRTVATPTIDSPANNATNQPVDPTFLSSAFTPVNYTDSHVSSDWQVARDAAFSVIYLESQADDTHKTDYKPSMDLLYGTDFYTRVRYHGSIKQSQWSSYKKITTKADDRGIAIARISHTGDSRNYIAIIGNNGTAKVNKFNFEDPLFINYTPNTPGSHLATDWTYGQTSTDETSYTASTIINNDSVNKTSFTNKRIVQFSEEVSVNPDITASKRVISGNYKTVNGNSGIFYKKYIALSVQNNSDDGNGPGIISHFPIVYFVGLDLVSGGTISSKFPTHPDLARLILEIFVDNRVEIPNYQTFTHVSTRWRIYKEGTSTLLYDSGVDEVNKTSITVPDTFTPEVFSSFTMKRFSIHADVVFSDGVNTYTTNAGPNARAETYSHISNNGLKALGSHPFNISSNIIDINNAPLSGNIFTTPAVSFFNLDPESTFSFSWTHNSTTWILYEENGNVAETSINDTVNKQSWTPSITLKRNTKYIIRAIYNGPGQYSTPSYAPPTSLSYRFKTKSGDRIFTVSPDSFGKSLWDLDLDGQFIPEQNGVFYTLTSIGAAAFTVKSITVGASGGGNGVIYTNSQLSNEMTGGCGSSVYGEFVVNPGDVLVIISGTRGIYGEAAGYPGGGKGRIVRQSYFNGVDVTSSGVKTVSDKFAPGGAGGGYSAIFRTSATFTNALIVAGGGGGANTFLINKQEQIFTNTSLVYTIRNIGNGLGGRPVPAGFTNLPGGGGLGGISDPLHYVPHVAGATYYNASYTVTLETSLTSETGTVTTLTNSKFRGQQLQGGHADEIYYLTANLPTKNIVAASGGGGGGYYGGGAGGIFPWAENTINKDLSYFAGYYNLDSKGGGNGSSYTAVEVANGMIFSTIYNGSTGRAIYLNSNTYPGHNKVRPYAGLPGEDGFVTIY